MLGIADPDDAVVAQVSKYDYPEEYAARKCDYTVDFEQSYNGIPVDGGSAKVMVSADGQVFMVKNYWQTDITAPTRPALSADEAVKLAQKHFGTDIAPAEEPRLCVLAPGRLCWRMNFNDPVFKEVFLDAVQGEVVRERPNVVE
jgi:Zn-dependent metalloprotease